MAPYKHLSPSFKQQSVDLIAGELAKQLGTKIGTGSENTNGLPEGKPKVLPLEQFSGGADGTGAF
jgi:hypothetical protein